MFYDNQPFNIKDSQQQSGSKSKPPTVDSLLKAGRQVISSKQSQPDYKLDDQLLNRLLTNFKNEDTSKIAKQQQRSTSNSRKDINVNSNNNDILGTMAKRLSQLETLSHNQRQELKEKQQEIYKQQEEINNLKLLVSPEKHQEFKNLVSENNKLKLKIMQMEKFLNEYDLKWVGEDDGQNKDKIKQLKGKINDKPIYDYNLPTQIDMSVIERRIDELNIVMQKSNPQMVVKDISGAHRIKKQDPILIGFYKNGLVIEGFKFHEYASREGMQILADILEGFFPYQLKNKFPEGVFLKSLDKLDQDYSNEKLQPGAHSLESIQEQALKPLSKEEFLNKLPKSIVKDGQVYQIRGEISKKLNGVQEDPQENETDFVGMIEVPTEVSLQQKRNELSENEKNIVTVLKIRTESGKRTLIIKLLSSDTMQKVYQICDKYKETENYLIAQNFPNITYQRNNHQTLEELNLFPNSALNLKIA